MRVALIAGGMLLGMIGGGIAALMVLYYLWPLVVAAFYIVPLLFVGMFTIAILHRLFEGE